MNIKEYISSGIVESYVMGLASNDERREFENLCMEHPELIEARTKFELALEKQAMESAIDPPAYCKDKIWSAIKQIPVSKTSKITTMEPTTRRSSGARWLAAASIILLLGAAYFAYTFYTENKELKQENKDLAARVDSAQKNMSAISDEIKERNAAIENPNAIVVSLIGNEKKSSADIYWDSTSANVYMIVKNMPKLPNEKQYQLWALIDNKPVDLGLFDGGKRVILKMNNTQKADAFAITIEDRGNTGGPNLNQLESMDKVKL